MKYTLSAGTEQDDSLKKINGGGSFMDASRDVNPRE
jgi:hypothetical protein